MLKRLEARQMGKWFPFLYDQLMKPLEEKKLKKIRKDLIGKAGGESTGNRVWNRN
jgi:hypothetical protein